MKRIIVTFVLLVGLLAPAMAGTGQVAAVKLFGNGGTGCGSGAVGGTPDACNDESAGQSSNTNPVVDIIRTAIAVLSVIIGVASVFGILINGLRMIIANGDSNSIASARSGIIYSLIGLAVAILSQVIVVFVLDKLP